jgi:hypothetical protein
MLRHSGAHTRLRTKLIKLVNASICKIDKQGATDVVKAAYYSHLITDTEYRNLMWHISFACQCDPLEKRNPPVGTCSKESVMSVYRNITKACINSYVEEAKRLKHENPSHKFADLRDTMFSIINGGKMLGILNQESHEALIKKVEAI